MADPRNQVLFDDIHGEYVTMIADNSTILYDATKENGSAQVGLAVMMSGQSTVALTSDNAAVAGRLIKVEKDLKCNVQTGGYAKLPAGASATVTAGKKFIGALGASSARGYIKQVAAGTTPTAAELDGVAAGRGMIIDSTTTTEVVVRF